MRNIFITFNQNSEIEENTALRMQTLSNLYGFTVNLPYRLSSNKISEETKSRINSSRFVLAFSIDNFTNTLQQDIDYALSKGKPIIVIYDSQKGRNIRFQDNANVKEVYINYFNTDETLHEISQFLKDRFSDIEKKQKDTDNAIGTALVAVGLGLLAYWALSNE